MLKKALTSACVIFTALVVCYTMGNLILNSGDPAAYLSISSLRVLLFFPFAIVLEVANGIFEVRGMDLWLKVALHFIVTMLDAYLCLMLPIRTDMSPAAAIVGMFLLLVVYAAVLAGIGLVRSRRQRNENAQQDYTPVYTKKNDRK